jgi:hypothetical protein
MISELEATYPWLLPLGVFLAAVSGAVAGMFTRWLFRGRHAHKDH